MRDRAVLCSLVVLALLGCPRAAPRYATLADARAAGLAARAAAEAARDAKDPAAAADAAATAADALRQAEALGGATTAPVGTAAAPDPALAELRRAAREAGYLAQETDERARLEAQLSGLKAGAYRQVRGLAVTGFFKGLAAAAREADARGLDALPEQARAGALDAARWAEGTLGRPRRADGQPDWKGIAADMDGLAAAPPRELAITLALGFTVLGKSGLALVESEALDPAAAADPVDRLATHLLRAFVRNGNGYRRLAVLEVERGLESVGAGGDVEVPGLGTVDVTGPQVLGGMHLLLAAWYVHEKDHGAADRELALSLRAWPDNPAAVFITGERLLASGEREQAAESLERAVKGEGEDAEWLAAQLAARARRIRDGEADAGDGLLGDPAFMTRIALHALWKAAERSPEAARVKAEVERARRLCADVVDQVPGLGAADAAPVPSSS